jgi:hypothetical protein
MRYKSLSPASRSPRPDRGLPRQAVGGTGHSLAGWLATRTMAMLMPALVIPLLMASGAGQPATLVLDPSSGPAGSRITVAGAHFAAGVAGQLLFDGSGSGMPRFHADFSGSFHVSFTVPTTTGRGLHSLDARPDQHGHGSAAVVSAVVSATFTVGTAGVAVLPQPTAVPTPGPTPIPGSASTGVPTSGPTPAQATPSTGGPNPIPAPDSGSEATGVPAPVPPPAPTPVPTSGPTPTPRPTAVPAPVPRPAPSSGGAITHVVIVWLENHEASSVTSSSMPYLAGLAATYGSALSYDAVSHPSLPNYLAFWSGSTQGVTDDGTYNLGSASLSSQLTAAGVSWRTYAQNYPAGGCNIGSSYSGGVDGWGVAGTYARKHNPAMSFTSVSGSATECAKIQPLAAFNPLVNLAFVVPNLCNDAHDCSLASADAFLQAFSPQVFGSSEWAHTLYVVTFDEGTTGAGGGGHIFTMVARAGLSHFTSSVAHNHYGLMRTIEDIFGVPCLNNSCGAAPLSEFLP